MDSYDVALDAEFLKRLRHFVGRRVPSPADADDVLQDVLVKLLRKGGSVPAEAVRAWLFTVARHEIHDRWRTRGRTSGPVPEVPARDEEDDDTIAYLSRCMAPMLASLPPEDRDLLQRVDVLGASQAEVARSAGLPLSTVKSRVQRARARLRDVLEGCCRVERDRRGTPIDYERRAECPSPCDPAR